MASRGVNTPGIKKLLEAEAHADDLVKQAKNAKTLRLKRAKEEAVQEIAKYKDQREAQLQESLKQNGGGADNGQAKIDKDKEVKMAAMKVMASKNADEVVTTLIDAVCNVELRLHDNFKGPKQQV